VLEKRLLLQITLPVDMDEEANHRFNYSSHASAETAVHFASIAFLPRSLADIGINGRTSGLISLMSHDADISTSLGHSFYSIAARFIVKETGDIGGRRFIG
jgi:hypothetical protein